MTEPREVLNRTWRQLKSFDTIKKTSNRIPKMMKSTAGKFCKSVYGGVVMFGGLFIDSKESADAACKARKTEAKRDAKFKDNKSTFSIVMALLVMLASLPIAHRVIPVADTLPAVDWLEAKAYEGGNRADLSTEKKCNNVVSELLNAWGEIKSVSLGDPMGSPQEFLEKTLLATEMLSIYLKEISYNGVSAFSGLFQSVNRVFERVRTINLDVVPDDMDEQAMRESLQEDSTTCAIVPVFPVKKEQETFVEPSGGLCRDPLLARKIWLKWGSDNEIGADIARIGWMDEFIDNYLSEYPKSVASLVKILAGQMISVCYHAYRTILYQLEKEIGSQRGEPVMNALKGFCRITSGGGLSILPCLIIAATICYSPQLFCPGLTLVKKIFMFIRGRILILSGASKITDGMLIILMISERMPSMAWFLLSVFGASNFIGAIASAICRDIPFQMQLVEAGWIRSWDDIYTEIYPAFLRFWESGDVWTANPFSFVFFSAVLAFILSSSVILKSLYRPVIDAFSLPYKPVILVNKITGERLFEGEKNGRCADINWQIDQYENVLSADNGRSIDQSLKTKIVRNNDVFVDVKVCNIIVRLAEWMVLLLQVIPLVVTHVLNAETTSLLGQARDKIFFKEHVISVIKQLFPVVGQLNIGDDGFNYITSLLASYATIPKGHLTRFV